MGKIIVIEGLDASGKATQARQLEQYLNGKGKETYTLDLPYYSDSSSTLVKMYLAGEMGEKPEDVNAYAASTFYAVDRYASFKKHWEKEYNSDKILVANRYTTSNASHQMTKLPKEKWDEYLQWLFDFEYNLMGIPKPDCVIYLDMPVEISQRLLMKRYQGDSEKKDLHEKDTAYLYHCREAALYAAEKLGWHIISCGRDGEPIGVDEISGEIGRFVERTVLSDD